MGYRTNEDGVFEFECKIAGTYYPGEGMCYSVLVDLHDRGQWLFCGPGSRPHPFAAIGVSVDGVLRHRQCVEFNNGFCQCPQPKEE